MRGRFRMPREMGANLATRSAFNTCPPLVARVGVQPVGVNGGRGNVELPSGGGSAAGEPIHPRAKRLVPILHGFRIHSERDKKQLSLFGNLNEAETIGEFGTISSVREIDPADETPVLPFDVDDDSTTEFVRMVLQRAATTRGHLHKLEKRSGISSGYFTKLLKDKERTMRVGIDFVRKFAPALGYDDMGEFFFAVGQWWQETGRALVRQYKAPESIEDPELRNAVESAKGIASREVIERVMAEYPDQIGKRNHWWWIERMIEEAKADFQRQGERNVEKKKTEAERRKLKDARHAAPESSRTLAGEAPPPPAKRGKADEGVSSPTKRTKNG